MQTLKAAALGCVALASLAATMRPPSGPAGQLRSAVPMASPRAAHTATPLATRAVLVVGGFTAEESSTGGAELFDESREVFEPVESPREPRYSHSATRLEDGTVLIAGGYRGGGVHLNSAERFDPVSRKFSPAGTLGTARADHAAVLLQDGRVLIAGGVGPGWTFLSSAEIYDPRSGRFIPAGNMTEARESHVAVRLRDGRVLIAGGHNGRRRNLVILSSAEIFDPATGQFTAASPMTIRRHKHDAVLLADGRVLVSGGSDERDDRGVYSSTEVFDPRTARFQPAGTMLRGHFKHRGTSMLLPDGKVLLADGATEVEVYDPVRNISELAGGTSRTAGRFSASALLGNGKVLITGGYGGGRGPRADAWIWTP